MKRQSIKVKITVIYTFLMAMILGIILIVMLFYVSQSEYTFAEENLQEAVVGFTQAIKLTEDGYYVDDDTAFYNEGVMFAIYDSKEHLIYGSMPEDFPRSTKLVSQRTQNLENKDHRWMVYDRAYSYGNGQKIWIRGIESIQNQELFIATLRLVVLITFPLIILIIGILSYHMLKRALRPVHEICQNAEAITDGSQLSMRLELPRNHDEMFRLTSTINGLFQRLEESFEREKEFTSNAAHELRTPIAVMTSQCEYLLAQEDLSPEIQEDVTVLLSQVNKMATLVSHLLFITRSENGTIQLQFEAVDLRMLVDMVVEELKDRAIKKQMTIQIQGPEELWMEGDQVLLMRLFINLIDNAICYGKENGKITVSIQRNQEQITAYVEDDGMGISMENQKKVWNRFYRVDQSKKEGLGLGLSMCQWIVHVHRGRIWLESQLGKGSRFSFTLNGI